MASTPFASMITISGHVGHANSIMVERINSIVVGSNFAPLRLRQRKMIRYADNVSWSWKFGRGVKVYSAH